MTIQHALLSAIKKLHEAQIDSPHLDAEIILSHICTLSREQLLARQDTPLKPSQAKAFTAAIRKRVRGLPVAYLTGTRAFYGLDFLVSPAVLIPRPDTETLIDAVLKDTHRDIPLAIADVGTGSGCIAIVLSRYLPKSRISALDISAPALAIAKKNVRLHRAKRITLMRGDLLVPAYKKRFDIIVANLPYLTAEQLPRVPHEPRRALHGGRLGIELIDRLIAQAPDHLTQTGKIFLEIDPSQSQAVGYIVQQFFPEKSIHVLQDLAGNDRVVIVK